MEPNQVKENIQPSTARVKSYPQRPKGRTSKKPRRSKGGAGRARPDDELDSVKWQPTEVKRCALQTLGGGSHDASPLPLKGEPAFSARNSQATLRKMKRLGGDDFFDKCYLSSEDEREAEERGAWALSPSDTVAVVTKTYSRKILPLGSSVRAAGKRKAGTKGTARESRSASYHRLPVWREESGDDESEEEDPEETGDDNEDAEGKKRLFLKERNIPPHKTGGAVKRNKATSMPPKGKDKGSRATASNDAVESATGATKHSEKTKKRSAKEEYQR